MKGWNIVLMGWRSFLTAPRIAPLLWTLGMRSLHQVFTFITSSFLFSLSLLLLSSSSPSSSCRWRHWSPRLCELLHSWRLCCDCNGESHWMHRHLSLWRDLSWKQGRLCSRTRSGGSVDLYWCGVFNCQIGKVDEISFSRSGWHGVYARPSLHARTMEH